MSMDVNIGEGSTDRVAWRVIPMPCFDLKLDGEVVVSSADPEASAGDDRSNFAADRLRSMLEYRRCPHCHKLPSDPVDE